MKPTTKGLRRDGYDHIGENLLCGDNPLSTKQHRSDSKGGSVKAVIDIGRKMVVSEGRGDDAVDNEVFFVSHNCVDSGGFYHFIRSDLLAIINMIVTQV